MIPTMQGQLAAGHEMDSQQLMYWSLLQQCERASVRSETWGHGARGKQWEVRTADIDQNC